MKPDRKQDPKVYLIAREVELARILAGNDQKARDKALKNLNKLLQKRAETMPYTEEDFRRIWKGLFYCMWMSDKPLVQEECADRISKLTHFADLPTSLLFFKAGLFILGQEWTGIDQLRLDKFLMLVRRLLREAFQVLKKHSFAEKNIESFNKIISETILNKSTKTSVGLFMHFNEIFLEELAKVSEGKIQPKSVITFLQPFIQCLIQSDDMREISCVRKFIFNYLMRQSDVGMDYQEKYEAWKQQGFPGSINSMQKVKIDIDDQDETSDEEVKEKTKNVKEKPLDPRAGRVDVEIPQLRFRAKDVANTLLECKFDKKSSTSSRNTISALIQQFNKLANGVYPLGIKKIDVKDKNEDINIRKAANKLIKFEQKLLGKDRKRKRDKENSEKTVVEKKRMKLQNDQKEDSETPQNKTKTGKDKNVLNGESSKATKLKKKLKKKHLQESTKINRSGESGTLKQVVENKNSSFKSTETKSKLEKTKTKNVTEILKTKKGKQSSGLVNNIQHSNSTSTIVKAKDRLKNKKSEKLNRRPNKDLDPDIECIIERNSGTWFVYEVKNSSPIGKKNSPKRAKSNEDVNSSVSKEKTVSKKVPMCSTPDFQEGIFESPKSGLSPVKLFESPSKNSELFPKTEWDEPLQEGEYEICIPSKKYIGKLKKQQKHKNQSIHEVINTTLEKIRGKSKLSLDSRLANNPFAKSSSAKKVKINTKLNKSQEVHEHIANVISSPAIPYDASRKPSKPLLKPTVKSTPVNPFYKKQLSIF